MKGKWRLELTLALGVTVSACGAVANEGPDTSSHWLQVCDGDDSCGDGQACLCGVCTTGCEQSSVHLNRTLRLKAWHRHSNVMSVAY